MQAVIPLFYLVLSYLIGAIPFGWLFCKLIRGVDIRDRGSKGIGATNVFRVLGATWAALTFVLDSGKGLIVVLLLGKYLVGNSNWALVFGLAAIVGHCFPVYLMSKGGKGGATTFGVALAIHPFTAIMAFVVWIVIVAAWRYVSLATMIAVLSSSPSATASTKAAAVSTRSSSLPWPCWLWRCTGRTSNGCAPAPRTSSPLVEEDRMHKAGFVVHPVSNNPRDARERLGQKFPYVRYLPPQMVYSLMRQVPIRFLKLGVSSGIRSLTGEEVEMIFWAVPYSPEQMLKFKPARKVIAAARYCEQRGAENIGLGGYASIIGEYGQQVANAIKAGVTTGNSLTAATGVEGLLLAARRMGYDPRSCTAAVIGAGGSVGKVASQLLAEAVSRIILVGRDPSQRALQELAETIGREKSQVCSLEEAAREAMLFITVTSATTELEIEPCLFPPGAVICDIARPRDISHQIAEARDDLLVFEGAILKVPGDDVDLGFNFGFPPGMTYACMAETMVLALEGVTTDYSLGKELELWRVREIATLAKKHGFTLAGFRSFEHALEEEQIDRIRERAINAKAKSHRGR